MTRTLICSFVLLFALPTPSEAAPEGPRIAAKDKKKKGKEATVEATPAPPPPDADGDGRPDSSDTCADQAEDVDGFQDEDGCPDPDNDADGVADAADRCPGEPENKDGWTDDDGCPEAPAKITPFLLEAELNDGTIVKGKVVRVTAYKDDGSSEEPLEMWISAEDAGKEFGAPWADVKGFTAEKFAFTENINCYSDGVEELGDERVAYECTLKLPYAPTLTKSPEKGKLRISDSSARRWTFSVEITETKGPSAEIIQQSRQLDWWLFKMAQREKGEDETAAMTTIQGRMKELLKTQPKKATFKPAP